MFNDNTASGERGKSSSRQTNTRIAIFCASKIRYLGQGVRSFLVGLSGESCFVLRLRSEINEKPFDFPSKERARAGRNCELR